MCLVRIPRRVSLFWLCASFCVDFFVENAVSRRRALRGTSARRTVRRSLGRNCTGFFTGFAVEPFAEMHVEMIGRGQSRMPFPGSSQVVLGISLIAM